MDKGVHGDGLPKDEGGKPVEVDRMDTPVDDQVACYAEKNQEVHAGIKDDRRQEMRRETTKGRGGERTGGHQEQAAVELRLFSPIDRQGKRDGEGGDVIQGNDEKGLRVGRVQLEHVETRHGDGGRDAEHRNGHAERDAEPADPAMPPHVVGSDQRGLEDEEEHPPGEDGGMKIKNKRAGQRRMDEVPVHSVAEAVDDHNGDQQGHEEVEIFIQQARPIGGDGDSLDGAGFEVDLWGNGGRHVRRMILQSKRVLL